MQCAIALINLTGDTQMNTFYDVVVGSILTTIFTVIFVAELIIIWGE
jgi:hypothetical protein